MNDLDSTYYLIRELCYKPIKFLPPEEAFGSNLNIVMKDEGLNGCYLYGHYAFVNNNNVLELAFDNWPLPIIGDFGNFAKVNWKINKLTQRSLWIETTRGNIKTWIHFKKV